MVDIVTLASAGDEIAVEGMMNCPKCSEPMTEWFSDFGEDNDTYPCVVDMYGYACKDCKLTFLDNDQSNFDGIFMGKFLIVNTSIIILRID